MHILMLSIFGRSLLHSNLLWFLDIFLSNTEPEFYNESESCLSNVFLVKGLHQSYYSKPFYYLTIIPKMIDFGISRLLKTEIVHLHRSLIENFSNS